MTVDQIAALCDSEYGLTGEISRLGGENDNFLITTGDDHRYVLKLAGDDFSSEMLDLEYRLVEHIYTADLGIDLPRLVPTHVGNLEAVRRAPDGSFVRARLLRFVPGTPWCESGVADSEQLHDLGSVLGTLDLTLSEMDHPAAHRTHRWDLAAVSRHREKIPLIMKPVRRQLAEQMFQLYAAGALPELPALPHSLIHGDANDENVLVLDERVSGLLDFGDSLYNPTICELAIAVTYAMLDQPDPLAAASEIIVGYHAVRPISPVEFAVLFPLICGRLCNTVAVAAERRQTDPEHPSWYVTEERAWGLLEKLAAVDPVEAETRLAAGINIDLRHDEGASIPELLDKRREFISNALSLSYREPLKMVRGKAQHLFDHRGRPYLDLVNNVCHVGHCHPRVVEAGQRQMARLNTNTRYLHDGLTEYAERLCATLPEPLDTCFLVNSGSEANELALRLAVTHTGRRELLVVDGAYHGNTGRLIDISPYKFMGKGGAGRPGPWVHVVPMPDGYRGKHKGYDRATGVAYGDEVGEVIAKSGSGISGFITESILSCAGQIVPPEGYFETAFEHVRGAGGVCIVDEVQVGFGRIGTAFWGFELQDAIPDIVVMGKPIGNGHPMAAVVTSREIAESFANGMEFFSTFGGNPVSCAIGLAVMDVIRDEKLQDNALLMGNRLRDGLLGLMNEFPLLGEVRGAGLFLGVELVRDRSTLEPAADEADELVNRMKDRGILLGTDGPLHNVIKIKPPLVLNADDVDMVIRCFEDELSAMSRG